MVYLDYSATTPVDPMVLDTFVKVSKEYIGNANSLHKLGVQSKKLMDEATNQLANLLQVHPTEIIYTSGATESNNMVIKGLVSRYPARGKQIITTPLEHSSILEPLKKLENKGYHISYVKLTPEGCVDLADLSRLLEQEDTLLVTIASVSSELGILQPIDEIGTLVQKYPKCFFHSDITQALGKIPVSLDLVDFASFSAHKFYGLKGIGGLIKKKSIELDPLFDGGKSTTVYRSGTPALPLIVSLAKALRLALLHLDQKEEKVQTLNHFLREELKEIPGLFINSTSHSIPHILNISIEGIKPETMLHALEEADIYISTMSACSSGVESLAVKSVTKDKTRASTSIRISVSHQTTEEEVRKLIHELKKCIERLRLK